MSLAYLVAFVSVTVCASTPTVENLVNTEVIEYLQRYGYLNEADVTTHTSIEDEKIKEVIALFQEYYQIPGNGILNDNTLDQIRKPRCGLPDMPHQEQNTATVKWKKTHLTWNFHLADANTLKLATYAFSIWAANTSLTFERKTLNPDILISYRGGIHTYIDSRRKETICSGLSHNSRVDSLMFPYATDKSVTLRIEDILAIQRLYGKNPNEVPSKRSPPVTTDTRKTSTQDLCDLPYVDNVLVLKYHIFVTYRRSIWMIAINDYPSLQLKNGWPKTYSDLNFPAEMRVNAALVTNRGQTYVIFDGDSVALMNECDMTISEYHSLKSIFPGIPPSPTVAYRYIDGSLYFLQNRQYYKFNEFTRTVTNVDNFDMKILNVNCPADGLLRQLQDLLNRLLQSSSLLENTAEDTLDE
ncbi:PREDICTED: matrix metalloproteinase-24-like [Cyphomyrmex costatus]|uniref:matrix metalloproteinase-24-like n=1 Tax=Cyphomyrmex costatus TaxID=456900 RepID=UPI000852416C|nr:PREDICTED: matrix metalloproteinase-24-like [Cyphomyrmex costatus]